MNKDDLDYLRDVLVTDHQVQSDAPVAADEIEAALADFTLQAEVQAFAAQESAAGR